jgi:hypothetical protein
MSVSLLALSLPRAPALTSRFKTADVNYTISHSAKGGQKATVDRQVQRQNAKRQLQNAKSPAANRGAF